MSLTATEKEQVAVLLGWERLGSDPDTYTWHLFVSPDGETHDLGRGTVTLEACMEYAKGKGYGFDLTYWRVEQQYVVEIHNTEEDDLFAESMGDATAPDPLTAFVRALLKAEEASK